MRSAPGAEQLDRPRLGEALLRFGDLDPDPVAGQRPGDEDDEPSPRATPRPPKASESISTSSCSPRRGGPPASHGGRSTSRVFCGARRLRRLFANRLGPAADLAPRLLDQPFQLFEQRVGLAPALFDQFGEQFLGVAAGHPAAFDGVVDDLLQAVTTEGDAALEAFAELLDALVEPGRRG